MELRQPQSDASLASTAPAHFGLPGNGIRSPFIEAGRIRFKPVSDRSISEEILDGELHDPWILCRDHLAESVAVQRCDRIVHTKTVGHVERFGAEFQLL